MDIFIYGAIGYEVDAKDIIADISKATDELNVHINSPGGNVYDGFAIFNALQKKRDILSTYIDGLAYSAASWLAISAPSERRYMSTASQFGIHQASNFAGGNKDELEKQLDALEKIDSIQVEIYSKATGLSEDRIKDIMSADRVLNLSEAKEFGFQEYQPEKIAALFKLNNMSKLDDLLKHFKGEEKAPEIEAKAEEKVKEAHAVAETPAEALGANFTAKKDFEELKASVEPFMTAIIDYIKDQPKQEEIEASIKKEVNAAMVSILGQIRTESAIPQAENTQFYEKKEEAKSFEPLTIDKPVHELLNNK
jgi:ATP-dependent protease ClpP protease subunit